MDPVLPHAQDEQTAIDRKRAIRRREVARSIKGARDRLNIPPPQASTYKREQLHLFADTRISATYAVPMLVLILGSIATLWIAPAVVAIWCAATIIAHGMMVFAARRYEQNSLDQGPGRIWFTRFTLGDLFYGTCWAAFFLLPAKDRSAEGFLVLQFAAMLIVVAMNTTQSATLPKALLCSTLPITMAATASFLQFAGPIHFTLAAMAIGAQGFFLVLGHQLLKNANTILEYRAEKDHLIAELETANSISDESRRRAEAANMAKSRFLATMSHELRTPLNAILGFSEIMKDEVLGPMKNAQYRSYAADIHGSGAHLLNLINEILDLSRIEAGRHELQEEAILLTEIVEECISMMQIRAKERTIGLDHQCEQDLAEVWVDERAMRQVVLNLLSNAIKFTPAGGDVCITLGWSSGGGQFIAVRDTGPGIPEDEIPLVLQAFGQGSMAIKSAEPGTGLGLSIVQALTDMHGGNFALKSKPGEGTEAIVTLPKSRNMNYADASNTRAASRQFA